MEDAFYHVVTEYKLLSLKRSTDFSKLKACLVKLEKELVKTNDYTVTAFRDLHYEQMSKLVFFLREQTDGEMRGYHDRIFKNILKFSKKVPKGVTRVFDDFIKGITYFSDDITTSEPVYHRMSSCGRGNDAFRTTYQICTQTMDKQKRKDVKKRIETCYIERMIYDTLYKECGLDEEQDKGHKHRLEITKNDFKTCFPNTKIDIDIAYDQHLPVKLVITRTQPGNMVSTEEYVKSITFDNFYGMKVYDSYIDCYKKTKSYAYFKNQSFDHRAEWKRI